MRKMLYFLINAIYGNIYNILAVLTSGQQYDIISLHTISKLIILEEINV